MSERTKPALAKIDAFLAALEALPPSPGREDLLDQTAALHRAVSAFHMEAIRFRMFSVERGLRAAGIPDLAPVFEDVRRELATAGFHTRSHAAP